MDPNDYFAPRSSPHLASSRRLAEELRATADAAVTAWPDPDALDRAAALVAEARGLLIGEPRPHFHDRAAMAGDPDLTFAEWTAITGRSHPVGAPADVTWADLDTPTPALVARVTLTRRHEGPPGCAHGGWVAAIFDELVGLAQIGYAAIAATAELTVRYRAPAPLGQELVFRCWYDAPGEGRRLHGHGTCHAGERLVAEAEGDFVKIDLTKLKDR